jgi:hypothetical protein
MQWKFALIGVLAALLSACAGPPPGVTGNDVGGIIPWSPDNEEIALEIASRYCAAYGKYARVTSVDPQYGGYIGFACVFGGSYMRREREIILRSRG